MNIKKFDFDVPLWLVCSASSYRCKTEHVGDCGADICQKFDRKIKFAGAIK